MKEGLFQKMTGGIEYTPEQKEKLDNVLKTDASSEEVKLKQDKEGAGIPLIGAGMSSMRKTMSGSIAGIEVLIKKKESLLKEKVNYYGEVDKKKISDNDSKAIFEKFWKEEKQ